VKKFLNDGSTMERVVFNVFTPEDERLYSQLLS
jgi:hypothetical protein